MTSVCLMIYSYCKDIFQKQMRINCDKNNSSYALLSLQEPFFLYREANCPCSAILVTILWLLAATQNDCLTSPLLLCSALLRLHQLSPVCFLMSSLLTFYQPSDNGITGGQTPSSTGLQWHRGCLAKICYIRDGIKNIFDCDSFKNDCLITFFTDFFFLLTTAQSFGSMLTHNRNYYQQANGNYHSKHNSII